MATGFRCLLLSEVPGNKLDLVFVYLDVSPIFSLFDKECHYEVTYRNRFRSCDPVQ